MIQLILYTTSHCHLCDQAESILLRLRDSHHLSWQSIEISNDDNLIAQYGVRIPVIKNCATSSELGWPFNREAILDFLKEH